ASKRVALVHDKRFTTSCAACIPGQRIDEAKPAVGGVVVPRLPAATNVQTEVGPCHIPHAQGAERPSSQPRHEGLDMFAFDDLRGIRAKVSVEFWDIPVVPHLMA